MSIINLIKKDIKIVLSDKKALLILIAMPIILFTILSFALAGTFGDESKTWNIRVGIVKLYDIEKNKELIMDMISSSEISQKNQNDIKGMENILFSIFDSEELDFVSYEILNLDKAKEKLETGELESIIILPEYYIADLFINMTNVFRKPIDIKIIKSDKKEFSSKIVENILLSMTNQLSQVMISSKVTSETLNYYNVDQEIINNILISSRDNINKVELKIKDYKIDKLKRVGSGQYYSVAMMTMFLLFGSSYGAKFMLIEKKEYTLQRQKVAGLSEVKIVIGKLAIIFLIAIIQISIMIATSYFIFKVYWGNPISVILLTILVSIGVTGMGTVLSAISLKMNSLKAINILESGIFQVLALFGGSYIPLYFMPDWFKVISKILLNGAALDSYHKIMMNAPLNEYLFSLISIFINAILFLAIGLIIISRKPNKNKTAKNEVI